MARQKNISNSKPIEKVDGIYNSLMELDRDIKVEKEKNSAIKQSPIRQSLMAAEKSNFQEGGTKTFKSEDGTITNTVENSDGSKTVQVKTKNGKYFETKIPKAKGDSEDSLAEDIVELVDPTGISSWDDVKRAYDENGLFNPKTALEILGALPLIGKVGKSGKILAGGEKLFLDSVKYFGYNDKIAKAYNAYRKIGGKNLDDVLGLTTKGLVNTFPKLNPNKWASSENVINSLNKASEVAKSSKLFPYTPSGDTRYQDGGIIVDSEGQYSHPGKNTLIPNADGRITMKDVKTPVLGIDDQGNSTIMQPEEEYQFQGNSVLEIPITGDIDSLVDPTRIKAFKKLFSK